MIDAGPRRFFDIAPSMADSLDDDAPAPPAMPPVQRLAAVLHAAAVSSNQPAAAIISRPTSLPLSESETPVAFTHSHFLDQVSDTGSFKTVAQQQQQPSTAAANKSSVKKEAVPLIPLHLTVGVSDIMNIQPLSESFELKLRLYMLWEVDLHAMGMERLAAKALAAGHHYPLSRQEFNELAAVVRIPDLTIFNAISNEETPPPDMRVYGGAKGNTCVMWNREYHCTCRERFELHSVRATLGSLGGGSVRYRTQIAELGQSRSLLRSTLERSACGR